MSARGHAGTGLSDGAAAGGDAVRPGLEGLCGLEGIASLDELFGRSVAAHGMRPALWVEGRTWTYAELAERAGAIASAVTGRQCGVFAARSVAAFAGVLGALRAGRAYVPLNPRHPPERLRAALLASDVGTMVVDEASEATAAATLEGCGRPFRVLLPDARRTPLWVARGGHEAALAADLARAPPPAPRRLARPGNPAYLLFTSGSTGAPKGVVIRHGNVLAYLRTALARWRPTPRDRFTQLFDLSFDLSVHDMFVCWAAGACLYCPPTSTLAWPAEFVRQHALTFWFSVPSTAAMMDRLHMLEADAFPSLRLSLFCGEALPPGLARKWSLAAPDSAVENLYGPTEATIAITAYALRDDEGGAWASVPIGRPFPGHEAVVIDREGRPLPDGASGELALCGPQVAEGYWRLADRTAERFAPPAGRSDRPGARWYRTGDRVVKDPAVGLVFLGRLDRETKILGHRIDLQEVEAVLRWAAGTQTAAALAWPPESERPERRIVAFVAGAVRPAADIAERCRERLPPAVAPREVRVLLDWPVNANGKADHGALARLLAAPAPETEGEIADVQAVAQAAGA